MFPDRFGQSLFMESKLSDNKRDKLKDSEFGIPDKRAYPLNDKSHVEAAVRMFPHADDSDKKELAKRIISKAKEFNMDTSGWDSLNEYIQESVAHGALLKVNDFKYDKVYFGSPNKISSPMKLDRPLFVSPFPGIASIFAVRPQNLSELGISVPNGKRVNKDYDEWNPKYKDTILRQPLKEVHIRLEGLPDFKPVTMMRQGYVYEIDVSNLKDNIYRNSWMIPVFEFLIANIDSVEFSNMTEVNIKTHIYGSELPKRFSESFSFDEPIQESMLQDIKNGVNPNSKKLFFHISLDKDLNGKTFKPRIPSYLTKKSNNDSNEYKEDKTTPRVCFSPSIEGCLRAILSAEKNLDIVGERIYVYIPDKPISEYKVKTNKEIIKEKLVFDAKMTKEMWILEPVKLKLYGVIYVDQVKNIRQSETLEGDPIGKVDYKWHWAVSPKYVDGIIDWMDEKDKTETVQEAMVDVAFNNLRCKIADALGDKYKVSNIIHNSMNSAKDKFTVALSSNTSKFVNVVNDTTGVSVLGYLRNISMSHAFDRLMEFFTSPEFVNESATIKIKEEFYMSDFARDPSILRLFQEAKDSDEDEKEEEIDENLDESSEDIVDDDSEEPTTFGSDTSDVQNEYNPKDVEALNNLIAAENDAMNDYFEAGKNTNDDLLTRLYADIGAEERFHAEQLLYAKSVLTGEKYEPRDPEVKKEYEELLEMGMDEETAMTTAVDRLNIMNGSDDDIDMEDIEDALSITEAMLCMNSEQLETMLMICESDKYDIDEFCDDIQTFTESYYIEGAVNVGDNKQVKEFKAKQDPLFFIARAFKNLFKFVIQIVKSIKQSMRALTVKRRNIADFIQKNGIKEIGRAHV